MASFRTEQDQLRAGSGTQRIQSLELRDLLDRLEEHFRGGIGDNRGAAGE
jgi:hypothetical protein